MNNINILIEKIENSANEYYCTFEYDSKKISGKRFIANDEQELNSKICSHMNNFVHYEY